MAAKARQVAEVARQEVARLRMERKALEQTVARRSAELKAIRQTTAQEVERRRDAELQRAVEATARQKAEETAQQVSVERARREVADADARRAGKVAADAAESAEESAEARRAEEEDEIAVARERRRSKWTDRARQAGNVAASIGIVAVALFGADRIFQLPDTVSRVPTVPVQPAEARPPVEAIADSLTADPEAAALPVVLPPDFASGVPGVEDPELVPAGIDPRIFVLDALADSADGAMIHFHSLAEAFAEGAKGCDELKEAYVQVDSRWLAYVVTGISRMETDLDEERATRHEDLSRDMQRVEVSYEVTGCPIP
jgi:hypothetical protein